MGNFPYIKLIAKKVSKFTEINFNFRKKHNAKQTKSKIIFQLFQSLKIIAISTDFRFYFVVINITGKNYFL